MSVTRGLALCGIMLMSLVKRESFGQPVGGGSLETPGFIPRTSPYPLFYADEPRDYNLRWGRLTGRLRGSIQTELNDNINLGNQNARQDVIFSPQAGIGFLWPISENNVLQFDMGVGYRAYVNNPELSSLQISPDSELNYQIRISKAQINFRDRFSIQMDPLSRPELSGGGGLINYRRFNNDLGFDLNWEPIRDITLVGGYHFVMDRSLSSDFVELDRDDHAMTLSAYHPLGPRISAGLGTSYTITTYTLPVQNDGETYSVGPQMIVRVSEFISIDAGAHYTVSRYEPTGTIPDASGFQGLTYFGGIRHRMNSRTTHYLRASQGITPGFRSNFTDTFTLQYGLSLKLMAAATLHGTFALETLTSSLPQTEDSSRYLFYLGTNLRISSRWRLGLAYSFAWKDSALAGRDYTQNRITLDLTRSF